MKLLKISQFMTWPIAFTYFHTLYRLQINGQGNFRKVTRPFIIIVNHFSFSDSFLFRLVLGFVTPNLPLRFMAVERFDWRWLNFLADIGIINFIYKIFGVFVVVPGLGIQKNLFEAKKIIGQKGNVVIYPEGKIATDHIIAPFKFGAAILATETGTPVIPISFHLGNRRFLRREFRVNIGNPIAVSLGEDPKKITALFYNTVLELYNK